MIIIIIIKRFGLYYQPCIQATRLKTRSPTGNRATSATSQRLFVAILRGPVTLEHGFIHYVILCLQHVHVLGPGCWGGVGGGEDEYVYFVLDYFSHYSVYFAVL